jgi:hypothetical protein
VKSEDIATCKEMPIIPVNKVMDNKRILAKRRAEEEDRHKGLLTPPPPKKVPKFETQMPVFTSTPRFKIWTPRCEVGPQG